MDRQELVNKILNNKDKIVGIKIDGYYYNVMYILDYNIDIDDDYNDNEPAICGYNAQEYEFTIEQLLNADSVIFYELKEV